jgi:photosystem II stability/assembly factor-like uncharacterized protein
VGYYGTILYSKDRGATWEIQRSGTRSALFRAVFASDEKGWISGSYGTILHTRDGGKSWVRQTSGTDEHLFGLDFVSEREGWASGSRGTLLYTNDGGLSWLNRSIGEDIILNGVSFISPGRGWVVGEFGVIYHTNNRGKNWLKQKSPVEVPFASGESRNLFGLLFPDSKMGWAFGLDGLILKTENGERWETTHKNGATAKLTDHHLFAAAQFNGMLWAVGERGTVIVSPTGSDNWQKAEIKSPPLSLNSIDFGPDGHGLIVGNRGLIFRIEDGGKQWKRIRIVPQGPGKGIGRVQ